MEYVGQGPSCPKTCEYETPDDNCTKQVEGCQCKNGHYQYIDENGEMKCVPGCSPSEYITTKNACKCYNTVS